MATLVKHKDRLALSCKYDEKEMAKSIVGCRWNPELKMWMYPIESEVITQLAKVFGESLRISKEVKEFVSKEELEAKNLLGAKNLEDVQIGVSFEHNLRNYQRVGANFLLRAGSAILADDMGTGKTLQAITATEASQAQRVLVICPNTIKRNWANELKMWAGKDSVIISGAKKAREAQLNGYKEGYLIINYEGVRIHKDFLQGIHWDVLILDEAHKIKNRKAQQTVAIQKIKAERVFLLTGTPMLNRAWELWSLLHRLAPKQFRSFWNFSKRFCNVVSNGYGMSIEPGTSAQEKQLKNLLEAFMIRRTKAEILPELPEKVLHRHTVVLTPAQKRIYKQMADDMLAKLKTGEVVGAPVVIAQITRLRQIAISPKLIGEEDGESSKIDALLELVEENIGHRKIVVFSQFRGAIDLVQEELHQKGINTVRVTGSESQEERAENTVKFQTDENTRVMLATIEAGGLGLTWTAADLCIFLDRHWTPGINTQAEDRLHRLGQKKSVDIINLVAEGTVEEYIENLLAKKQMSFEAVINGKEVSLEDLFNLQKKGGKK